MRRQKQKANERRDLELFLALYPITEADIIDSENIYDLNLCV